MAIDDNTSYELTGYQVKDLAQKVRAKADSASLASVATSGLYSDLTGAPTIPTVYNATLTIEQNGVSAGTFTANQSTDATISLADTTYSDFTGATGSAAGTAGIVPAPASGDQDKVLKGDGTWGAVTSTNIDWSTMPFELVSDTTIEANSSSSATIDIPIDLVTYRKLTIDFTYEASSGSSTWGTVKALDGSKNVANGHQIGIEYGPTATNINRNGDQIIAYGCGSNAISHASIELSRAGTSNYPAYVADGYGGMTGTSTSDVKAQKFSGRVLWPAQDIKYIRFMIPYAKAGGHVIVYGIR